MPVTYLTPVYDDAGNGIDAVAETAMQEIVVPETRVPRQHVVAHLFQSMIDDGFDPRDPLNYIDRMERDHALPGMPTEAEWEHGKFSLGEIASRKWLAIEFLALALRGLAARVAELERPA